ncbi:hypothetical protein CHCC15087_0377 [Bacillus licheniformis]|nr:hypothetical protein CHCC15087_0377 [Bacillus licheniformis]
MERFSFPANCRLLYFLNENVFPIVVTLVIVKFDKGVTIHTLVSFENRFIRTLVEYSEHPVYLLSK